MKINRNELCPCGSGKKFKRCHLYEIQGWKIARDDGSGVVKWIKPKLVPMNEQREEVSL